MIYDSFYWKKELYENYRYLHVFRNLSRRSEVSSFKAEKAVMMSAYVIRKLADAEKIPVFFLEEKVVVRKYPKQTAVVDHMNWHHVVDNYDLDDEFEESVSWRWLLNQIVHSFTFIFAVDEFERFAGVLVNSDLSKAHFLYHIRIEDLFRILLRISEGGITTATHRRSFSIDKNGKERPGPMRQVSAEYSYSEGFDLEEVVRSSMQGIAFERRKAAQH